MQEELQELGLSENEVEVYLTLLKTGLLTSYSLSEKTSLNRGYLYELLKKLHEKGIISEVTKKGKKYYQATNPEHLSALMQFKLESIKKIVPELKKIEETWKEETQVNVYKGKYCYKTLIKDVISSIQKNSEVLVFGINEKHLMDLEPLYLKRYFNIIERKHIKERVIIQQGTKPLQEAKTTQYACLPKQYIGKLVQFIYANKVALLTLSEPLNLIIIEDKTIAETYKIQFNVFWNITKNIHRRN
jgi:sugar-specific transcriptional regulator TrmB